MIGFLTAKAEPGISSNHQVNPPHNFKRLTCLESETRGLSGYFIEISVPQDQDAEAKVFFNRPNNPQVLIGSWRVKYILAPGSYATFANQFQGMDISEGPDDAFSLNIQLHSGNGKNGLYDARFESPLLLGRETRSLRLNIERSMICRFQ